MITIEKGMPFPRLLGWTLVFLVEIVRFSGYILFSEVSLMHKSLKKHMGQAAGILVYILDLLGSIKLESTWNWQPSLSSSKWGWELWELLDKLLESYEVLPGNGLLSKGTKVGTQYLRISCMFTDHKLPPNFPEMEVPEIFVEFLHFRKTHLSLLC